MLDEKLNLMLETAATLTADDLDCLRGTVSANAGRPTEEERILTMSADNDADSGACLAQAPSPIEASTASPKTRATQTSQRGHPGVSSCGPSAGEYERKRTRESKVSTACIGRERDKHAWWPLGTTLVGQIGAETFTATVVENSSVKSNRSLLITTGAASGRVCITPTRAAMEATEAYRQAHNLGRGGGVTNGWEFWKAQA